MNSKYELIKIEKDKFYIKAVQLKETKKGVKYIDLRFEILDHISTDIENEMTIHNSSFNEAFDKIRIKWSKTFSYKWTFWLGVSNGGSKLFIDHCLKIYKPLWFKSIL